MDFNLDFDLVTSDERRDFIASKDLSKLTQKEIELCGNYILYGKDRSNNPEIDGTSCVDRKEVQIQTKFQSYSKKEPISLDALLESPTFNENLLNPKPTIYKKVKPTIDREKVKDIPGMKELWEQIQITQDLLDENTGKKERSENSKILTQKQIYYLKHYLIDMRKQQYYLMDSTFQTLPPPQNKAQYFDCIQNLQMNYPVYPRGTMREERDNEFKMPRMDKKFSAAAINIEEEINRRKDSDKPYFNFLDKEHIYQLVLDYWDIKVAIQEIPDSPLLNLLWTLDFYIEKANLNEQQMLIVRDKKLRLLNRDIAHHLQEELGIYHQENYISTIWNKICQQIADAAELNYDEWLSKDYDKAWKRCNTCGKELLRDPRNFVRKAKSADGLTNCCKMCDKEKRKRRSGR